MTATEQTSSARSGNWLANQTYLLLSITALCWAGNAIVGRMAAGHIAPVTLSFLRWSFAFLIILPFAWKHLVRDWGAIRSRLGIMILLSITGIGAFNTLQYWALEHTQALNTLLLQSAGPLVVAVWSLLLLGVRLTLAQAAGVLLSMAGVVIILMHGDLTKLSGIDFNIGDLIFIVALAIFGIYSVLSLKRPDIHGLSFVAFTFGAGAACLIPLFIWELFARPLMQIDTANLLTLFYVALFPSTIAYLQSRRTTDRRQPRRAVLPRGAGVRNHHVDRLPRRASASVPLHRFRAGAGRRVCGVAESLGLSATCGARG
jgi:drug/metabolite transporter (DMT)-like permease